MTKQELYDLALKRGIKEPAVLQLGDRCILGEWIALGEKQDEIVARSSSKGIRVLVEMPLVNGSEEATWKILADCLRQAGDVAMQRVIEWFNQ